jgi:hypothetical protein
MRDFFVFLAVGTAILNGIFSADQFVVAAFQPFWYPWLFPRSPELIQFLSSIILSTLTLMVSGVPAGIYEKVRGVDQTDLISAIIWFLASVVIIFPTLPVILRAAAQG